MEERIIHLLKKYIERTISSDELEEIKTFAANSQQNRELVRTFIQLHKTEIQADFLTRLDNAEGWNRVQSRLANRRRKRIALWVASVAAILAVVVTVGTFWLMPERQQPMTMTAMMQAQAQNRAVITLNTGEDIAVDGSKAQQMQVGNGKIRCENSNGKLVYYGHTDQPIYNKVSVMEGSTYKIALSDGTGLTLASGSEVVYPIGGNKRDVKLKGEALFDVTHDEQKPFTVECANGVKVTVLGTRFNISAQAGKPVVVTVESGRVGVSHKGNTVYLNGGEQASFGQGESETVEKVDAKLYTSWASGIYEFNDVPMAVIAHQLSLWYGVDFVFASPQVKERKFTGALLRDEKLGYTLGLLKEVSNLKFRMDNNKIVIE